MDSAALASDKDTGMDHEEQEVSPNYYDSESEEPEEEVPKQTDSVVETVGDEPLDTCQAQAETALDLTSETHLPSQEPKTSRPLL